MQQTQVAIGTDDVYKSSEAVDLATKELGGKILRQPGPLPGINTKIASFVDPDGWKVVCLSSMLYSL
jgi:lactoylglutathione lyase